MFSVSLVMHKHCVSIPSKNVCIHLAFANAVLDRIRVQDVPGNFKHTKIILFPESVEHHKENNSQKKPHLKCTSLHGYYSDRVVI